MTASDPDRFRPTLPLAAAPLVPQQGAMCLLDTVHFADKSEIVALVTPRCDDLLAEEEGVFVHAAIEWMAQAAAAWSTLAASAGDAPREGMLLGVRGFRATCDFLPFDRPLAVRVRAEAVAASGLGHFSGALHPIAEGATTDDSTTDGVTNDGVTTESVLLATSAPALVTAGLSVLESALSDDRRSLP